MIRHLIQGVHFPVGVWAVLLSMSGVAILVAGLQLMHVLDSSIYLYVIQPVILVSGSIAVWWFTKGQRSRLRGQKEKVALVSSIMTLWVIGYFLTGIVVTYVQNPLMGSFRSIVLNGIAYGLATVCLEYIRYKVVLLAGRRKAGISGLIITIAFVILQLSSVSTIFAGAGLGEVIKLLVSIVIPIISYNFIQTYLAYTAGFGSMVVYATGWLVINQFLPITPHYDWYMVGMMSSCLGLLTVFVLDRTRQDRKKPLRYTSHHRKWVSDGFFLLIVAGLVCLMTGVFSYKPLVIMSNSMVPVYSRGDMVFVEKVTPAMDIKVGDIIEYTREDRVITHRTVKIVNNSEGPIYTAKGDNNQSDDPWPITRSQIKGIVKARIPYIGYPSVVVNELVQGKR